MQRKHNKNSPWIQLELELNLPRPKLPELRSEIRVLILPPHPEAGKTGRISLTPGWIGIGKEKYRIELRGKSVSANRYEIEPIKKSWRKK